MRTSHYQWGAAAVAVLVISALGAVQDTQRVPGMPWFPLFLFDLPMWSAWLLLAPAIVHLGRRFPLFEGHTPTRVVLHAVAGFVASGAALVLLCLGRYGIAYVAEARGALTTPAERVYLETALDLGRTIPAMIRVSFLYPVLFYFCILALQHAVGYAHASEARRRRELELEAQLVGAELHALKLQLQPHFLFNTLHTVSALMERDTDAARSVIFELSDLLRYSLRGLSDHVAPLEAELRVLKAYVHIQRARFGERLAVQYDIAPDTEGVAVPRMLLQPLVENAIRHGMPAMGVLTVMVSARRDGAVLKIAVRDDGFGPGEANEAGNGVGLRNARARLRGLYGERQSLVLQRSADGGAEVIVALPVSSPDHATPPPAYAAS